MIELKILANDVADLHKQMRDLLGSTATAPVAHEPKAPPKAAATKTEPPKAEDPKSPPAAAPTAEPPQPTAAETASDAGSGAATSAALADGAEQTYDYETVIKPGVLSVSQKLGRKSVLNMLAGFGVDHTLDVPVERYPELMATIAKLLEG